MRVGRGPPSCRPRIHDLCHSFAVNAKLDAYARGQHGQTRLTRGATAVAVTMGQDVNTYGASVVKSHR